MRYLLTQLWLVLTVILERYTVQQYVRFHRATIHRLLLQPQEVRVHENSFGFWIIESSIPYAELIQYISKINKQQKLFNCLCKYV